MSAVIVNDGITDITVALLKGGLFDDLVFHLYENDLTPSDTDALGAYTEVTADGYAPIVNVHGSWTGSTTAGVSTYTYPTLSWTIGPQVGGHYVYGWYATVNTGDDLKLLCAQRFSSPLLIPSDVELTLGVALTASVRKF